MLCTAGAVCGSPARFKYGDEIVESGIFELLAGVRHLAPLARDMKAIQVQKNGGPGVLTFVNIPVPRARAKRSTGEDRRQRRELYRHVPARRTLAPPLPFVDGQEAAGTWPKLAAR